MRLGYSGQVCSLSGGVTAGIRESEIMTFLLEQTIYDEYWKIQIGNALIVSCGCRNDIRMYSNNTDYNKMNISDFIIIYWKLYIYI